jgi:hypothetical protein
MTQHVIRSSQIEQLDRVQEERFEARLAAHLTEHFPEPAGELGPDGVLAAIRHGVRKARGYGIETERDLCKYLDLMFVFGRDFDDDPSLPWASRVLRAPSPPDVPRGERLFALGVAHADEGQGFHAGEGR